MKKLLIFIILILLMVSSIAAQELAPRTEFVINMDFARFRNDELSGYLEVYYAKEDKLLLQSKLVQQDDQYHIHCNKVRLKDLQN